MGGDNASSQWHLTPQRLIASLETESEIESAWSDEVRSRDAEFESGKVGGIPLAEFSNAAKS